MKIDNIDVSKAIESAKNQIDSDKSISPALRSTFELLLLIISIFIKRLHLNSNNSSKSPSQDPNRPRKIREDKGKKKKPGGQKGHPGTTLEKIDNPDEIEEILVNRKIIPSGPYRRVGFETRQVFDINISTFVTEYRAEILGNQQGVKFIAEFPDHVTKAVQYGNEVKGYMSQFQLILLARVGDYFNDQMNLPISKGSIANFNREAFERLADYEEWARDQLLHSPFNHADETGINLNGKKIWLHNLSNSLITLYHADEKRGTEAMDRMGVLPYYSGTLCHDHWSPYYTYPCFHALCNAHHLRELTFSWEEDAQKWEKRMHTLLEKMDRCQKQRLPVMKKVISRY